MDEGVELQATQLWSSSPDLLLSGVSSIAVDSQGNVYAWDMDAGIVVLGPEGETLRTFSRKGQGPGEYQVAGRLQVLPGDSLCTFDPGLRRATVFAPDTSAVAYTVTLGSSMESPGFFWMARVHHPPGYLSMYMPIVVPMERSMAKRERIRIFRLHSLDGTVVRDSVLVLGGEEEIVLWRTSGDRAVSTSIGAPFGSQNVFDLSGDDLIVHGRTDSLAIEFHDLEGRRVGGFSAPYEGIPITPEDVDRRVTAFRESPMAQDFGDEYVDAIRDAVPETWPAFLRLLVDDRGRIWIWLTKPEPGPSRWTVFERSGERIGTVVLAFNLRAVREGVAYGEIYDEFGVPTIVAYRIGGLEASE